MKIPLLPAIALALFPLSIGCESSGHQQSDAAGTRMDQLRTAAQAAKDKVTAAAYSYGFRKKTGNSWGSIMISIRARSMSVAELKALPEADVFEQHARSAEQETGGMLRGFKMGDARYDSQRGILWVQTAAGDVMGGGGMKGLSATLMGDTKEVTLSGSCDEASSESFASEFEQIVYSARSLSRPAAGAGMAQRAKAAGQSSMREIETLAERGDVRSQMMMGAAYEKGDQIPQDYTKAAQWYHRAAEQGHAVAQVVLAGLYAYGQGVPTDRVKSARWLRAAADQGDPDGQFLLGLDYLTGAGVPKDPVKAYQWLSLAAAKGLPAAGEWRDKAAGRLTAEQLSQARQWISAWAPTPTAAK